MRGGGSHGLHFREPAFPLKSVRTQFRIGERDVVIGYRLVSRADRGAEGARRQIAVVGGTPTKLPNSHKSL
jgi:hypothetical protein